jgi:Family of unknown function (DUF5767)
MEVVDIGLGSTDNISIQLNDDFDRKPSVNFGPGIELLMNDKKKSASSMNTNVDLGELDKLESELNSLTGNGGGSSGGEEKTVNFGGWFGGSSSSSNNNSAPPIQIHEINDSNLGEATANSFSGVSKSSDGFGKLNTEIPLEYAGSRLNDREKRRKKRMMIKKLDEWYEKGIIKSNSHFNMDSNFEEVEDEYEGALEEKRKKDSVKLYGWWFMTVVNSVEYANAAFNPFDLNLDGWGESVSEDLDSYDEIFTELYQKYKGGKIAPEISLLLRLGVSAAVVNFTNKALSTATPAFNDVIRQNPELMKMFTNATVQSMSQNSPGFGMAAQMMNREPEISTTFGPPPAPVSTKNMPPPPQSRSPMPMNFTGMSTSQVTSRPDIMAGRGGEMERTPMPVEPPKRPEMRGPQNMDLENILSGLKTRDVVLQSDPPRPPPQQQYQQPPSPMEQPPIQLSEPEIPIITSTILNENDSMISVTSLRDMQNATAPKRGRRKQRSDRNTISLDI